MRQVYLDQVELLLRCLPHVEKQTCFALKGGTAINLFLSDMPRLSVDIDLVYLPIEQRDASLKKIADALLGIKAGMETTIPGCRVDVLPAGADLATKLVLPFRVQAGRSEVAVAQVSGPLGRRSGVRVGEV